MIDLDALASVVGLPEESATVLTFRSALALERRHEPGVRLVGKILEEPFDEELRWRKRKRDEIALSEDINRVTEEGAEAVALALVGTARSWRVVRRLQSRLSERADWLLVDPKTKSKVVLEVGGTDEGELRPLLVRKIQQARRSPFSERGRAAACEDDGPR
jgi:hypothetical protein